MEALNTNAERQALRACELEAFKAIKLDALKDKVAQLLTHIGDGGIFDQYTKHDITHVNKMLESLDNIIPASTQDVMTAADWILIVVSTYFHDLGMLVTKNEFQNRNDAEPFRDFRKEYLADVDNAQSLSGLSDEDKERFVYQEYVRHHHGDRVASWIRGDENAWCYSDPQVQEIFNKMVEDFRPMFKNDLATVCESHNLDDLDDFEKYKVEKAYGSSPQEKGNVFYAALIVRTADLLHITSDRTPSIEYSVISPTNPISQEEWAKQNAVSSVSPKIPVDEEGNKNDKMPKDTFEVSAYFEKEDGFFALIEYLDYARKQLKRNYKLNEIARKKYASKYEYPWRNIDDSTIENKDFERRQLSFTIDQQKILSLLVGETLYNNLSVSLRELSQNAIDAVKVKLYELQDAKAADGYKPRVDVYWDESTRELMVCDNGTGMDMNIIENHLLKVGSSRYQDAEFQKKHPNYNSISRFGIGLLTCFLIADDVDILTQMNDKEKPLLLKIRKVHGKYLLKHGAERGSNLQIREKTGTSIKLKVRPSIVDFDPEQILTDWILIPNCQFYYHEGTKAEKRIGFDAPKHLIESVLKAKGISLSDHKYKILDYNDNGIELAILLSYNSFMKEYSMVESNSFWLDQKQTRVTPWGMSIEGIRIDENTPGFKGHPFVAYANMVGKEAPKTNVARSNVNSASVSRMLRSIYKLYLENIEIQRKDLQNDFSVTWVAEEMTWLLNSLLLRQDQYSRCEFSDIEILKDKLSSSELLLVENMDKREFCSLNSLVSKGHFWTIESEAFAAANSLLKEIKSTDKSAVSLLKTLYGEEEAELGNIDVLLCKQRYYNLIDDLILSKFEISKININEKQRRLDLYWSLMSKEKKWHVASTMQDRHSSRRYNMMFIQTSTEDMFEGPYDAIKSSYGLIIPKCSALSTFFNNMLCQINVNDEDDNVIFDNVARFISDMFTKYRQGVNYNWKKQIERAFDREANPSFFDFVFGKIQLEDLVNACSSCQFRLYDSSKWYRSKSRD